MKKLMDMSPYQLGESGREEAIKYLIMYLSKESLMIRDLLPQPLVN